MVSNSEKFPFSSGSPKGKQATPGVNSVPSSAITRVINMSPNLKRKNKRVVCARCRIGLGLLPDIIIYLVISASEEISPLLRKFLLGF